MDVSEDDCDKFDTSGSWPLFNELYRRDAKYRQVIESTLNEKDVFPQEIFSTDGIQEIWQRFLGGDITLLFEINALLTLGTLNRLTHTAGVSFS